MLSEIVGGIFFIESYQLSQEEYVTISIPDQCFTKTIKENTKTAPQSAKLAWYIVIDVYK